MSVGKHRGNWLGAVAAVALLLMAGAGSAVASTPVENGDPAIGYGGWVAVNNPNSLAGHVRESSVKGDTITYSFSGATFSWYTEYGPDEGEAKVTLDGTQRWTVNLYAAASVLQPASFGAPASGRHRVVIKVLGKHSASSIGNLVVLNGLSVNGKAPVNADSPKISYDQWKTTSQVATSAGTFQSTAKKSSSVSLTFSGIGVTWVTANGPTYGKADVSIDGVDQGSVDLYAPTQTWQVDQTYAGLANGTHTITITALGAHDASASGNGVVLDSLIAIPQPTLTGIAVTPSGSTVHDGQTLQYTATGTYSDGSQHDLTTQVTWSTNSASVASISNAAGSQGLLTPITGSVAGVQIQVTATLGAVSGSTSLTVLCPVHSNGLGGTYIYCVPLGVPGNAATYSQAMATAAALSWGHGSVPQMFACGSFAPFQDVISIDNTNGPSANWSYTNGSGTSLAGYVNTNPTGIADLCPIVGDATWN